MSEPAQPKKRGRPPKPQDERKGQNLTFRTRADFRERLEQAAVQSGRSVTEEVELRVERSFEIDRIISSYNTVSSIFMENGHTARVFASSLMGLISSIQETTSKDGRSIGSENWKESPATRVGIRICAEALLDYYAPKVTDTDLAEMGQQERNDVAHVKAVSELWAMMATGRENEVVDRMVRQDDADT